MSWKVAQSALGPSVGSNFQYDPSKRSLTPSKKGIYFMYIQVTVHCTHKCQAGTLKLEVADKLTCHVELTDDMEKTSVSKKCWTVTPLDSQDLIAQMTVPKETQEKWSLDHDRSGLGLFLVEWRSAAADVQKRTGPSPCGWGRRNTNVNTSEFCV